MGTPDDDWRDTVHGVAVGGKTASATAHEHRPAARAAATYLSWRTSVEFLVCVRVKWPADGDVAMRDALVAAERIRSHQLAEEGVLVRLWRVPGQWANWGLWKAMDASSLHDALTSLPLWPWLEIDVHPLAKHPNDPAVERLPTPAPNAAADDLTFEHDA